MSNHTSPPIICTSSASGSKPSLIDPGAAEPRGTFCPPDRDHIIELLRDLDACDEALAWIEQTPGKPEDLWAACQRGDWMIWLLVAAGYDKQTLRHIACDCAEEVLHIYEQAHPTDRRPREYITVARRYADGEATEEERNAVWDAAWAVAKSADWTAAKSAAYAVAWAASGDAAWAAANAATEAASSAAAKPAAWARQADMVRARVSWTDVERAIAAVDAQEALSK